METHLISPQIRVNWGWSNWSPLARYIILCVAYFSILIGFYLFNPFGFDTPDRDTWHHTAVLRELMSAPFSPSNPHIPTDEPSRYFTPINILAALIGKIFGFQPWQVFSFTGAIMCLGLCASCWLFAKTYFRSTAAPTIFLTILLFGWGLQFGHVGMHNFATFTSSAGYPATQTFVLGIFGWFLCAAALDDTHHISRHALGVMLITAILIISHQFSAFLMLIGFGSFIVFHLAADTSRKIILLAAILAGGVLSLFWPYFSPLDVILSASDPRWNSPQESLNNFLYWATIAAPAFIGVFGLYNRKTRQWRLEIVSALAFFFLTYAVLAATGSSIAHRMPPAIILYLQLGLCWAVLSSGILEKVQNAHRLIFALCIGLAMFNGSLARIDNLHTRAEYGPMLVSVEKMRSAVPTDAIAFATEHAVFPYQSTGRKVVSIPRPEPVAPSLAERQSATDTFFAAETSARQRDALVQKWNASHIVFAPLDISEQTAENLRKMGSSQKYVRDIEIITLSARKKPQ